MQNTDDTNYWLDVEQQELLFITIENAKSSDTLENSLVVSYKII